MQDSSDAAIPGCHCSHQRSAVFAPSHLLLRAAVPLTSGSTPVAHHTAVEAGQDVLVLQLYHDLGLPQHTVQLLWPAVDDFDCHVTALPAPLQATLITNQVRLWPQVSPWPRPTTHAVSAAACHSQCALRLFQANGAVAQITPCHCGSATGTEKGKALRCHMGVSKQPWAVGCRRSAHLVDAPKAASTQKNTCGGHIRTKQAVALRMLMSWLITQWVAATHQQLLGLYNSTLSATPERCTIPGITWSDSN